MDFTTEGEIKTKVLTWLSERATHGGLWFKRVQRRMTGRTWKTTFLFRERDMSSNGKFKLNPGRIRILTVFDGEYWLSNGIWMAQVKHCESVDMGELLACIGGKKPDPSKGHRLRFVDGALKRRGFHSLKGKHKLLCTNFESDGPGVDEKTVLFVPKNASDGRELIGVNNSFLPIVLRTLTAYGRKETDPVEFWNGSKMEAAVMPIRLDWPGHAV